MTDIVWCGTTRAKGMSDWYLKARHEVSDAAKAYEWDRLFSVLNEYPDLVNATRPKGRSLFTPLHQAAKGGASNEVIFQLIARGAWRTIENEFGERPVDVASRCGHLNLISELEPVLKRVVPAGVLRKIQENFHAVIRGRAGKLVLKEKLRLPELSTLLEIDSGSIWFMVPGMYGGFSYWLEDSGVNANMIVESWCRVEGGSGQRHAITSRGFDLIDEGFV